MKILSINTANKQTDITVLNNNVLYKQKLSESQKSSETAMVEVDKLLVKASVTVSDLDAFAVVVGPGSFTGIRIGISLGLGFKTVFEKLNLIEITAFEFLQQQFLKTNKQINQNYLCVFNALSNKYFVQEFDKDNNPLYQPKMVEGDDFVKNHKVIVGLKEEKLSFLTHQIELEPEVLNDIAAEKFKNKQFSQTLTPLYLRKSQAEDMLKKSDETKG